MGYLAIAQPDKNELEIARLDQEQQKESWVKDWGLKETLEGVDNRIDELRLPEVQGVQDAEEIQEAKEELIGVLKKVQGVLEKMNIDAQRLHRNMLGKLGVQGTIRATRDQKEMAKEKSKTKEEEENWKKQLKRAQKSAQAQDEFCEGMWTPEEAMEHLEELNNKLLSCQYKLQQEAPSRREEREEFDLSWMTSQQFDAYPILKQAKQQQEEQQAKEAKEEKELGRAANEWYYMKRELEVLIDRSQQVKKVLENVRELQEEKKQEKAKRLKVLKEGLEEPVEVKDMQVVDVERLKKETNKFYNIIYKADMYDYSWGRRSDQYNPTQKARIQELKDQLANSNIAVIAQRERLALEEKEKKKLKGLSFAVTYKQQQLDAREAEVAKREAEAAETDKENTELFKLLELKNRHKPHSWN
ncbi:hypothetical protein AGMMS50233_09680 [Endomicrobiia bacterium]|nr:hypothetical protein AGMMS50233_09680 [Endomicrobiia bacterium]